MMTTLSHSTKTAAGACVWTALLMIAGQTAGKAARDALFLSSFSIGDLPKMIMAAALLSVLMMGVSTRLHVRWSPARLIPIAFISSGLSLFLVWAATFLSLRAAAILFYLHLTGFGVVLISGFWSLVNERFDPYTAKKIISRIVGGAAFGGLAGGIFAERLACCLQVSALIPSIGCMHLLCAWQAHKLTSSARVASRITSPKPSENRRSAWQILNRESHLRNLAFIVLASTMAGSILDYVYKVYATQQFNAPEDLTRFFAWYYMGVGLVTFLVQTIFSKRSLENLGVSKTVAILPLFTLSGSLVVLAAPFLLVATTTRLLEAVLHNSLFRTAYELFFVPIPSNQKRAVKAFIDVGFDKLGDVLGAGWVQFVWLFFPAWWDQLLPATVAVLAAVGVGVSAFLKKGYVGAMQKSLLNQDRLVNPAEPETHIADTAILHTLTSLDINNLLHRSSSPSKTLYSYLPEHPKLTEPTQKKIGTFHQTTKPNDLIAVQVMALRSSDLQQISSVLNHPEPVDIRLTPHIIPLLAWDESLPFAVSSLRKLAADIVGQLTDSLLNPKEEFIIRRRLPWVLGTCSSQRGADGLALALSDQRFEVRYHCAKAIACIQKNLQKISIPRNTIIQIIESELIVAQHMWQDRRLLDSPSHPCALGFFDPEPDDKINVSLDHVFTLLTLIMDDKALKVAYRGLYTSDQMLRGTAMEYLDVVLPAQIKKALMSKLGERPNPTKRSSRDRNQVTQNLLLSSTHIDADLSAMRKNRH